MEAPASTGRGLRYHPLTRRIFLTGTAGVFIATDAWAKPRPKPGVYSNTYSNRY